jgi:hypothetical protein
MAGLISKELHEQIVRLIRKEKGTPVYSDTGRGPVGVTPDATPILFKAPSGGVPKRVGTLAGSALCRVWGLNISTKQLEQQTREVTVRNWATSAACTNGDRYGWAQWHSGSWWVVSEDCGDSGSSTGGTAGSLSSFEVSDPVDTTTEPVLSVATVQDVPYQGSLDAATVPA